MKLSLIQPLPAVLLDLDEPNDVVSLTALYRPTRPDWLRINLIQSLNGAIVGVDGTSNSLSNRIDRKILGIIRSHADVILVGAETVRAEGHVLPLGRDLAVLTNSGDLTGHNLTPEAGRGRLLVLHPAENSEQVVTNLSGLDAILVPLPTAPGHRAKPDVILNALRGLGYRSILCEGGRSLASQLVTSGQVDELCLTVAPVLAGAEALGLYSGVTGGSGVALGHLLADSAGVLYSRWTLGGRPTPSS